MVKALNSVGKMNQVSLNLNLKGTGSHFLISGVDSSRQYQLSVAVDLNRPPIAGRVPGTEEYPAPTTAHDVRERGLDTRVNLGSQQDDLQVYNFIVSKMIEMYS